MYGYALLVFTPRTIGIEPSAMPVRPPSPDEGYSSADLQMIREAVAKSPLAGFSVGNNTSHDGLLRYDGKRLVARIAFDFDPREGVMAGERSAYAGKESMVNLTVWFSVDRSRQDRLAPGSWASEDKSVGVTITNDPAKDDHDRMCIFVVAMTMAAAREALIATLEGKKRPEAPWII